MARPRVAPAPAVIEPAGVCRDLGDNPGQLRHVPHDLTGLSVRPNRRLATMARGLLDRADHPTRARVRSEAPWRGVESHRRRVRCMPPQPQPPRRRRRDSRLGLAET
jgi:hypothetical protein